MKLVVKIVTLIVMTLFMMLPAYLYSYVILQNNCSEKQSNDTACLDFNKNYVIYHDAAYWISMFLLICVGLSFFMNVYNIFFKKV